MAANIVKLPELLRAVAASLSTSASHPTPDISLHRTNRRNGSTASIERTRHVGFTPDSGRKVATQPNDASGQSTKSLRDSQLRRTARL